MFYKSAINVKNIGNDGVGTDFVQLEQLKATCGILTRTKKRKGSNGRGITTRRGFGFTSAAKPKVIAPNALGAKLCASIMALLSIKGLLQYDYGLFSLAS